MIFLNKSHPLLALLAVLVLGGCAQPSREDPSIGVSRKVEALTLGMQALGPDVDPVEAALVARIAVEYPLQLRREYGVTDPPLIHNTKVNLGLRPRGLCYQWADDLEARLRQEPLRTLQLHRAIANSGSLLIDHSTVIVSRRGATMFEGIVLDGWRQGGDLFWAPTLEDPRYTWVPRAEVFASRRR